MEQLTNKGGFLLCLRQEGRGIGLYPKIDSYALKDNGMNTFEANVALGHKADERDDTAAAQMLRAINMDRIRCNSNNRGKATQLQKNGIKIAELLPTGVRINASNQDYLISKRDHVGRTLEIRPT